MMPCVGIDVSAKKLFVVTRYKSQSSECKEYANDSTGHRQLIQAIHRKKCCVRVCLEATGTYHFDIAVALSKTPGIEVMVVNPRASKRFSEALMRREKTDTSDADVLARYVECMDFIAWQCPDTIHLQLRMYARRLTGLTKQKTQLKNQLHAFEVSDYTPNEIIQSLKQQIGYLEGLIKTLRQQAMQLVYNKQELKSYFNLLMSVKGIGEISALQILGELMVLPQDMRNKQWVAHAGLDPCKHQSGTSINKKTRISKAGNRYLRHALYMPALSASQYDPYVRGYYLHLVEDKGLKKMQAICAVMRKLLLAIHAIFKNQSRFENTKFYCTPVEVVKKPRKRKQKVAIAMA